MKILLIGGSGSLINRLIVRLDKEGHRVFLLTGSRFQNETYEHVFERYDFPYSTEQIQEIFESVNPDVTIFTGAFDPNYDWKHRESRVCAAYLSDLINLLMAFSMRRHGRFLYLSSEAVYAEKAREQNGEEHSQTVAAERHTENMPPDNTDYRGLTFAQAEKVCRDYRDTQKTDIVTLRIGGLFHRPASARDTQSAVASMCLSAYADHRIFYDEGAYFAPLGEGDAVQFILQVAAAESCAYPLYQIAADRVVSGLELAEIIKTEMRNAQTAAGQKSEEIFLQKRAVNGQTPLLANTRYREAFGINRFSDLQVGIREICTYLAAHPEVFLDDREKKQSFAERLRSALGSAGAVLVPVLENLLFFALVLFVSGRSSGSRYFSRVDFYLLYVLLFAVIHGQQMAILSATLSAAGYIFLQMGSRAALDVIIDPTTYIWVAQLFIVGLVVGYMRDRITSMGREAEEDHRYMARQVADIEDINDSNVRVKDALETQVISQNDSVGEVYEVISGLDRYSSDEVLFYAADVIGHLMQTRDVAIYTSSGGPYFRLFTATTKKARSLGNSIQIRKLEQVSEALLGHRVFINRELDPALPVMACASYEEDSKGEERIGMIVMVWGLSWERTTLAGADLLAVICALIQSAEIRARRYLEAIEEKRRIPGTPALRADAFSHLLRVYAWAEERSLTSANLVRVTGGEKDLAGTAAALCATVRDTDLIGVLDDGDLYVLLTNTDKQGAGIAMARIRQKGLTAEPVSMPELEEEEKAHMMAGGIASGRHR